MNAGNGSYNYPQPLHGENDDPTKKYCRQWQANRTCTWGKSFKFLHEINPDYKGTVTAASSSSSSGKISNLSSKNSNNMPTPEDFTRIKPKQTVSPSEAITPPANPSKLQVTPARLSKPLGGRLDVAAVLVDKGDCSEDDSDNSDVYSYNNDDDLRNT